MVGKARRRVAAELIADLERIYRRAKEADKELKELVAFTGTTLMDLHGIRVPPRVAQTFRRRQSHYLKRVHDLLESNAA